MRSGKFKPGRIMHCEALELSYTSRKTWALPSLLAQAKAYLHVSCLSISYYYLVCRSSCKAEFPCKVCTAAEKRKKRAFHPFFLVVSINIERAI